MKRLYLILLILPLLCSCVEDLPVGFISPDGIRLREDTLQVTSGVYLLTAIPMVDGSTRPLHFEVCNARDLTTGKEAGKFMQKYPTKVWTSAYNPKTDTTLALVNAKLNKIDAFPVVTNTLSGQLHFNTCTQNLDPGLYGIDVKVSSRAGERTIENYGIVRLIKKQWVVLDNFSTFFYGLPEGSTSLRSIAEANPLTTANMNLVKANTHPDFSIEKIEDGTDNVKVKLMFLDANGKAFDGNAIAKRPKSGTNYENSWFDNSVDTKILPDGVEFNFPVVPFPSFGIVSNDDQKSISISQYTLHPSYYTLTPEAIQLADKSANAGKITYKSYTFYVKISYQLNEYGSWVVKIKFPYALKK